MPDPTHGLNDERLRPVLKLARACRYELEHTHQVTRLALRLFDVLRPLHRLDDDRRYQLACGALLHDIGWYEGWQGHHKTALRYIRDSAILPWKQRMRLIVGSIARYHRKAAPSEKHQHFAALSPDDRDAVCMLAGMLRVADALDRSHRSVVNDLHCDIAADRIALRCDADGSLAFELDQLAKKKNVFEAAFGRPLHVTVDEEED